jgi:hypothetical protein
MATAEQIQKAYIDFVLTNDEQPKSVYIFAKKLKITEADFYSFYTSFDSIEKVIWFNLVTAAIDKNTEQEVWEQYSSKDKMLAFFYSFTELLKSQRSFVCYSLKKHKGLSTPTVLTAAKETFENFAQQIIEEGLESGELADRKFFSKKYKDALWVQFGFIVNFWINDDSHDFEKTDEAIERGIQLTFDLFKHSPIDNLVEYGKFLHRNGKLKERMGF